MKIISFLTLFGVLLFPSFLLADASIPRRDLPKSHDPAFLKRYQGSLIIGYRHSSFDEMVLPISPLKPQATLRDRHNNVVFAPSKKKVVEGEYTRIIYLLPRDRSPLEVIRNYQNELSGQGGKLLFRCSGLECGGDPGRSCAGGGGDMSLSMFLEPQEEVLSYNRDFSNGYCALMSRIDGQHFMVAHIPTQSVYLSVLTYELKTDDFCNALNRRTIAVVDLVKKRKMDQRMVLVKAEKMASEIETKGSVALYGIYFDLDSAHVKPESRPTLAQIAKLFRLHPKLKLLVVGHTDNQGSFPYNMELSRKRAMAVVKALAGFGVDSSMLKPVGVGYACPRATNRTPEGRAINRRVELVAQ